jgi:group I intron endonuclease
MENRMIHCGIYKIFFKNNPYFYIGSSKDIDERFQHHKKKLNSKRHKIIKFQRVFDKYGGGANLDFIILQTCEKSDLLAIEQQYLDANFGDNNFINIAKKAKGGSSLENNPRREEIINKIKTSLRKTKAKVRNK